MMMTAHLIHECSAIRTGYMSQNIAHACLIHLTFGPAASRTAVRTLCNPRLRTASGPEGSSAKQSLGCAAGHPDRGGTRRPRRNPVGPAFNVLPGPRTQVAAAPFR